MVVNNKVREESRFIVAGSFIDGSGSKVRKNVFLKVENSIIAKIGPVEDLPQNAIIDDFSHGIILPALVDCSVHLSRSPSVDMKIRKSNESGFKKKLDMFERHIRYCYAYGVLGVVESDDIAKLVRHYHHERNNAKLLEIQTTIPPEMIKNGSTNDGSFFKINYSGNIDDIGGPNALLHHGELCHILKECSQHKSVVVANGRQQVREALEAGCDAIEQGYRMGEENLKLMAEKEIRWIPSLLRAKNSLDGAGAGGDVCCRFSQRYVAPGKPVPGAEDFWKKMLADQLNLLRLAKDMGVIVAVGTGAGSVGILHGESVVEEMKLFIKAGVSLEETMQSASEHGSRFFGMENLGALKVGRHATFLIARGTVQQLPRKLSYLEGIYVDGIPSTTYRKNPIKTVR